MTIHDVDRRGQQAAHAARFAVGPVVLAASSRFHGFRPSRRARVAFVSIAVSLAAGLIAVASLQPSDTGVSTGPAAEAPGTTILPPTPGELPPTFPFEKPIASGQSEDGKAWSLFIGGPSNELCLGVFLGDGQRIRTDACGGAHGGAPAPDPYSPHFHNDSRIVPTVFGRTAANVVSVEVLRANGRSVGPVPVIQAEGGPFYLVELPDRTQPVGVMAYRADGTSVRYSLAS